MKNLFFVLVACLLWSCKEDVSSQIMSGDSSFGAQIAFDTSLENDKVNWVRVRLFDKYDKVIATNNIEVSINNTILKLSGGNRQRYYHPRSKLLYFTDSIPKSDQYIISVKTVDDLKQNIAFYSPLKKEEIMYNVDDRLDSIRIKWQLKRRIESLQLDIMKTNFSKSIKEHKDSVISINSDPIIGDYMLSKSFLETDDDNITTYFYVGATIKMEGMLDPKLLATSSIIGSCRFSFNTAQIAKSFVKDSHKQL